MLLNLRGETKHTHDLSHPSAGDALLASDICLSGDLAGFQQGLPLDGFAEKLNHPVSRHPAPQVADVAVLERTLGPKGDIDYLFAVCI